MMPSMNRCESGCSSWLKFAPKASHVFGFDRLHRCISSINFYYQTYVCMCMYDVYWYTVSEKSHRYVQLQTWFRIWWFKKTWTPPDSMPPTFLGLEAHLQEPCSSFHLRFQCHLCAENCRIFQSLMFQKQQYTNITNIHPWCYSLLFEFTSLMKMKQWHWVGLGAPNLPSGKSSPASRTSGCYLPWEQQGLGPPYAKVQHGNVMNVIFIGDIQ